MNDLSTPPTAEEIRFLQDSTRGTPTGELVNRVLFHYGQSVGRAQEAESQSDLEACVELVRQAGLATGHADSHAELMREVLEQIEGLRDKSKKPETDITIKTCPFCGGVAKIRAYDTQPAEGYGTCRGCGARGPVVRVKGLTAGPRVKCVRDDLMMRARRAWNLRAPNAP